MCVCVCVCVCLFVGDEKEVEKWGGGGREARNRELLRCEQSHGVSKTTLSVAVSFELVPWGGVGARGGGGVHHSAQVLEVLTLFSSRGENIAEGENIR